MLPACHYALKNHVWSPVHSISRWKFFTFGTLLHFTEIYWDFWYSWLSQHLSEFVCPCCKMQVRPNWSENQTSVSPGKSLTYEDLSASALSPGALMFEYWSEFPCWRPITWQHLHGTSPQVCVTVILWLLLSLGWGFLLLLSWEAGMWGSSFSKLGMQA